METLTVASNLIVPSSAQSLTPAMLSVLWTVAHELDRQRVPATVEDAVWLEIPSKNLKPKGRNENTWLRECLTRLQGLQIGGEYRSNPWGAVFIAEWHIEKNGTLTRLLVPPAAVQAMRLPETFAKIELEATYRLQGPARRLYAALADKKNMGQPYWTYALEELRTIFAVEDKPSYDRWAQFRRCVLLPAIEQINDFGTVTVTMTPEKRGRSVIAVRFGWRWKTVDEARETDEENQSHKSGRRKDKEQSAAPPLVPDEAPARSTEEKERGLAYLAQARQKLKSG